MDVLTEQPKIAHWLAICTNIVPLLSRMWTQCVELLPITRIAVLIICGKNAMNFELQTDSDPVALMHCSWLLPLPRSLFSQEDVKF